MTSPATRRLLGLALAATLAACSGPNRSSAPTAAPTAPATTSPGSPTPAASQPPASPPVATPAGILDLARLSVTLEPYAQLPGPAIALAAPGDGSGRLFVATQDGHIWLVEGDGTVGDRPMLDLDPLIDSGGERGLLGIALHPAFPDDPRIFVDYTDNNGDTIVASVAIAGDDPDRFDEGSRRQILFVDQPYANHNGGALAFGPDGYLYISLGDGGSGGDPHDNGQRLGTLLGKILRIDVDNVADGQPYAVPEGNPYEGGGTMSEIWLSGLRNPWRMSFDRATGDLWIGDVGQGAWEEVDVAPAGAGGLNFGWRIMEGAHCFRADPCDRQGLTLPVSEYGRDQGCTIIGGNVYRGTAHPSLVGAYLFADYCTGRLFAIDAAVREITPPTQVGSGPGQIAAWGEDTAGELYVLNLDGTVSRVVATQR